MTATKTSIPSVPAKGRIDSCEIQVTRRNPDGTVREVEEPVVVARQYHHDNPLKRLWGNFKLRRAGLRVGSVELHS